MKIAIVGSGISGLASAWLLARSHEVTLFEAQTRAGGHSHTVDLTLGNRSAAVDTGFLVHNDRTYPNLVALFSALGIRSAASDMSFSVHLDQPEMEWCGSNLATVFAQPRNLVRSDFWSMLHDIVRFNRDADRLIDETRDLDLSLDDLIAREGYGRPFRDWYLLPMGAAIWSSPANRMRAFPAHAFLCFCANHGLMQISNRPQWKSVVGGSQTYVERMLIAIPDVRLGTPVRAVRRDPDHVRVMTDTTDERFDQLVLACHSDQSLALLQDIDALENGVLGAIQYQQNDAVLHTDAGFLPRRRLARAAWNFQAGNMNSADSPVSVTYLCNRLQPLPFDQPVMVTLNPHREPDEAHVHGRYRYAHPLLDRKAWQAQSQLDQIQGARRTWFAGAWTGYGFHEDGLNSALRVVNALGTRATWQQKELVRT